MNKNDLYAAVNEAYILGAFKKFCNIHNNAQEKSKIRNILANSSDKVLSIRYIFKNERIYDLNDDECIRMLKLVNAYLTKSSFRKIISCKDKEKLLLKQNYECAICRRKIDISSHADHIVPFKYVGDELNEDNLQMLCSHCNESKNASIDYQIKYLLNLTN